MRSPTVPARGAAFSGSALSAGAAVLAAAFIFAPPVLVTSASGDRFADERHLIEAFRDAFAGQWRSGRPDFSAHLGSVVDYWFRYHLAKAVIAALLAIALVALAVLVWKAFLRAGHLRATKRVGLAAAGASVTALALVALAAVMANVQGAVAPFASLLPMLTGDTTDAGLSDTLEQVRQRLAETPGTTVPPTLQAMISDFARFHAAMAVVAAIVAVVLVGAGVVFWTRFARTRPSDRRTKRVLGSYGVLLVLIAMAFGVVAVANTTTAANPKPALAAFFDGGW